MRAYIHDIRVIDTVRTMIGEIVDEPIKGSESAASFLRGRIGDDAREQFWVVMMNAKLRIQSAHCVSIGSLTASIVHPREVFRPAILDAAHSIIVGHNHPSGDILPSTEDKKITKRLREAGETIGIPLIDHVIIGDKYYSFNDSGWPGC